MQNLMEGLIEELKRVRELLALYESIPTGLIGAGFLRQDILLAEGAISRGNIVEMLKVYKKLKEAK